MLHACVGVMHACEALAANERSKCEAAGRKTKIGLALEPIWALSGYSISDLGFGWATGGCHGPLDCGHIEAARRPIKKPPAKARAFDFSGRIRISRRLEGPSCTLCLVR